MACKKSPFTICILFLCSSVVGVYTTSDHLELSNLRYNHCGRYACPDSGKYQFSPDSTYEYLYVLAINSTFDKMGIENSQIKLEFKVELRIESCEGVLRIGRHQEKEGFSVFDVDGYDRIYQDVNKYSLRFSFYDGHILSVCPNQYDSILALNIKKGILSAFQNKMKRFDIDKFTSEKDVNGLCPTNYNLQRINGTTLVIRKIKDISNCLERCQLHSIIPTSRYIFQSKFHKWTPLNSTVVCYQTIDHRIPIHISCQEEHTLKILLNQTYSSRTLISQQFHLLAETPSYSNYFTLLNYADDIFIREDLSFNHRKPKKSEISEIEASESFLLQLCNITSEDFQLDAADIFAKFIHTARHLSYEALEILLDKSAELCSTGRKHVQDSLPFLRSTAALTLMQKIIIDENISESTANGWLFAMSLFPRPDQEVINSVTPMLYEKTVKNNVLLSISSIIHSYSVWANEIDDKEAVITAITSLETILNETLTMNDDHDRIIILLKSLGNAGIQTKTIGYTLAACIRNPPASTEVKISAIEAHRRLRCDFNTPFLLTVFTDTGYEAEVRIVAYLQLLKCPTYGTIKRIKTILETEKLNQVSSFVWSHMQNTMKSSLEYRVEIQAILQDFHLQRKFKSDFRKFSGNYEKSFYLADYGIGGTVISNVIFSTKTYIPKYITLNITLQVFGEIVNILEVNLFVNGLENYAEDFFKGGTDYFLKKLETFISQYRFMRSIPITLNEKIKSMWNNVADNFAEPIVTASFRLFGNEIFYGSCRGRSGIANLLEKMYIGNLMKQFMNGEEIKFDYSTVFVDVSYVSPTGAGVPLNLDVIGIAISNFDTSVFVNVTNFNSSDQMLIKGKLKPRFSVNFEGSMGTDLVYEQTQIQLRNKIFTSSEIEGHFCLNTFDDISLSFNLPKDKFDIFSFQSDLYYRNLDEQKDVLLIDTAVTSNQAVCFWPFLEQLLGLKICSTYYSSNPQAMLRSLIHILKGPFKFSLFVEKSDPTAKVYEFKYLKKFIKVNESIINMKFETPDSFMPRSMKTLIFTNSESNNLTILLHANKTTLRAQGYYRYTTIDKVLNFNVDINELRHVDLVLELHMRQEKRMTIYTPKLFFAVTSKPVAELSGSYRWMEKKGVSQCDVDLQFKTNKFDSHITGYIVLSDGSIASNMHIRYKFEKTKNESFNFEFKFKDQSTKLKSILLVDLQVESTSYPEINLELNARYQSSHDHIDTKLIYISSPFEEDNNKKLTIEGVFLYMKTFNKFKMNTFIDIKKPITDVNIKLGLSHQYNPTSSNSVALARYATGKDIIIQLETRTPRSQNYHYELKFNTTLPSVQQPMVIHLRILEKSEKEYDVDFFGTWFSGHTAMAKGTFQDKSNHFAYNYNVKLQVNSRLFSTIGLQVKFTFNDLEYQVTAMADHNQIRYAAILKHLYNSNFIRETYLEYIHNETALYYLNNHLDLQKKEMVVELHLDKYRDIYFAVRGKLKRWNSNIGFELKWDVNRDPSQKMVFSFITDSFSQANQNQYSAKLLFEYPGHITEASLLAQYKLSYRSLTLSLEMSPTSVIQLTAYSENELLSLGFARMGFLLLTPFENWKETEFTFGIFSEKQNFCTNGSLVWQGDQNIIFDAQGGYLLDDNITSLTLSSSLNSTLQDLAAIAFGINYTSIENEVHLSVFLQPNLKYSLYVSISGMVRYYDVTSEYIFHLNTRAPFLDYSDTRMDFKLMLMTENRIIGDFRVRLNQNLYTLFVKGLLIIFERTKLCLHVTTPAENYEDITGLLSYDLDKKYFYINLTGAHFHFRTNIIYIYRNLSNFSLRFEVITPIKQLNNLIFVGMYSGKALELRGGWNSLNLGFEGLSHFESWTDMEYRVHLYTPIETFKSSSAILKLFIKPEQKIVTARVILSNISKIGVNIAYNSEQGHVIYLNECEYLYERESFNVNKKIVLKNALFELDTLIYPTITAMFYIHRIAKHYTVNAKLAVFFFKMELWDLINYESMVSFNNTFSLTSSIDMFSSVSGSIKIGQIEDSKTNASFDIRVVRFNQELKGGIDLYYEYKAIDAVTIRKINNKIDGIHNVAIKLNTPLELLEYGEILVVTQIQNYVFETTAKMVTKYSNVSVLGNLQFLEDLFDLNVVFNMSSVHVVVPAFKIQILRDFSKLEKQVALVFEELTEKETIFRELFCVMGTWYVDGSSYISLAGELKSPFKILDELKASLLYSHELEKEAYCLEAYMKYSNKTEMKARVNLRPPNVTLNLETSMEGLRNAHFIGTLERVAPGQQKIDAIMITNPNFRIRGSTSITDITPFAIKGKLFRGTGGIEISSVEMFVKRKSKGYNILASLFSKGKSLNVNTEITDYPNNSRIIKLEIKTGRGDFESLNVIAELKLQHPGIYQLTVKGDSNSENIRSFSISRIEIWFRNGVGAFFASLDSSAVKGEAEIFLIWKPPLHVYAGSKLNLLLETKLTEIFNSEIFFWSRDKSFNDMVSKVLINLNRNWMMEANITVMVSSKNDTKLACHLMLPNKNSYSIEGAMKYNDKYDVIQHLILISRPEDIPCYTISDVNLGTENVHGLFAFKCGIKDTLFMVDNFSGVKTPNTLTVWNWVKSNTLTSSLITNVNYTKENAFHVANLIFYYPPIKQIAVADFHFESIKNFDFFVNTSLPYPTIPYFACIMNSKTKQNFYQRIGKIYLHNRPASVNITHVKTKRNDSVDSILNNGQVAVVFPVTTWHEMVLAYIYLDTLSHIDGSSELFYNGNRIINSTFTKNITKTMKYNKEFTHLEIGNKLMPIGINYIHETSDHQTDLLSHDFKRTEIYKLQNASAFNVTGETLVDVIDSQEWTTMKVFGSKRRIEYKSYTDGKNAYQSGVFLILKREFWFNYFLKSNKVNENTRCNKVYDLNLAYPRRNFSLISDFSFGSNYMVSQITVNNFLSNPTKAIGVKFYTTKPSFHLRETTVMLFHPSFEKNVTLFTSFYSQKTVLANLQINLEYSDEISRKLELSGIIEDKSTRGNRHYILNLDGKHPATRFLLKVGGAAVSVTGNHFIGNNITYKRSYLPEQFWRGNATLNTKDNMVEIQRISTRAQIRIYGDYKVHSSRHELKTIIKEGTDTHISGYFEIDLHDKQTHSVINVTEDASDRLQIEGSIPENREATFNIWRTYNDFNFPQMSFYLALNHSRFLSSALMWRNDIGTNILKTIRSTISYLWTSAQESIDFWTQFLRSEATETLTNVWNDAKPELESFLDDLNNIKTIQDNVNYFKSVLNDSYNANEFFLKDIHGLYNVMTQEMTFMDKIESLPKIVSEIAESMGETGLIIKNSFIWIVNSIKEVYDELLNILDQLVEGKAEVYIARFIKKGSEKFDIFFKDLHISFVSGTESIIEEIVTVLTHYQKKILMVLEPTFIEIIHHIDSTFWASSKNLIDFIYSRKKDLLNSPYILRSSNFTQRLDAIYKDLIRNDFITNVKKYCGLVFNIIYEYYVSQIPYREELLSIGNEIINEIKELYKLPLIEYTVDNIRLMYDQIMWIYEFFDISTKIQKLIPFIFKQYKESSYTALEYQMKNHKPKTKLLFMPETGVIKVEQKLPFPWHAFNETPVYEEIEEYKYVKKFQSIISTSKITFWTLYGYAESFFNTQSWFPPFKGHSQLIGFNNYITFDSVHIPFYGNSCQYLLSHDFMDNEFSLVLNSDANDNKNKQSISLLIRNETITIQFNPLRITIDSQKISQLPLQLNNTFIYFDHNIITVDDRKGITLKCNTHYEVCSIYLSGWFYGKISGLLGTMNNEPSDDIVRFRTSQSENYLWSVSPELSYCPLTSNVSMIPSVRGVNEMCNALFQNSSSSFKHCFNEVNPEPYYSICIVNLSSEHVCSVAMAYVESCMVHFIPLRIPASCVKCSSNNGDIIQEGNFITINEGVAPESSDIVFIVEAKQCNKDLIMKKNMQQLISGISKELISNGCTQNRYTLVVFGGEGIYSDPHSVVINSSVFSNNSSQFVRYFENIPTGNGSSDVFGALRFATKLSLRMGVSKIFILILCSKCDPANIMLDYSVLHHALIEKSITLHILMDDSFPIDKSKSSKLLFGLDSYTAYTRSDSKGDHELYRRTKLTKSLLGYCTPLALESNGTLFTSKPLADNKLTKKFVSVFAKRVASTAKTNSPQICECHSDKNGIPYTECTTQTYLSAINFDFSPDDESEFSPTVVNLHEQSINNSESYS